MKENTVTQDKYLAKVNNYAVGEVQRAIDKLDVDTRILLYSRYKMSEIWYLMNYNSEFCQYINKVMKHLKEYKKIADGLSKMKACLDKGEVLYTDEEIADSFVEGYGNVSEKMRDTIRGKLGLVYQDDIPKQEEEPVTMDKILAAYDEMSIDDKLKLDTGLRERDTLEISLKRFQKCLEKLIR